MIENFDQIKGFLHRDEGIALYNHCKSVSQTTRQSTSVHVSNPLLEVMHDWAAVEAVSL